MMIPEPWISPSACRPEDKMANRSRYIVCVSDTGKGFTSACGHHVHSAPGRETAPCARGPRPHRGGFDRGALWPPFRSGKGTFWRCDGPWTTSPGCDSVLGEPACRAECSGQLSLSRLICEMELTRAGGMAHRTLAAPPGRLWGRTLPPRPGSWQRCLEPTTLGRPWRKAQRHLLQGTKNACWVAASTDLCASPSEPRVLPGQNRQDNLRVAFPGLTGSLRESPST